MSPKEAARKSWEHDVDVQIFDRALEDCMRLLHQQGRTEIGNIEWSVMMERRIAQLVRAGNGK